MRVEQFWIPVGGDGSGVTKLNAFLASHQVTRMEKAFCQNPAGWSVFVEWVAGAAPAVGKSQKSSTKKIDHRSLLPPQEAKVFDALRDWRREEAKKEQKEIWNVAQNKHLADVVTGRITTLASLREMDGFGEYRVKRYGDGLIVAFRAAWRQVFGVEVEAGVSAPAAQNDVATAG